MPAQAGSVGRCVWCRLNERPSLLRSCPRCHFRWIRPLPTPWTATLPDPGPGSSFPSSDRKRIGFVVGHGGEEGVKRIRTVLSVMDTEPSVSESQLRLARWMTDYLHHVVGESHSRPCYLPCSVTLLVTS